jgi:hypothetical protein
MSPPLPGAIVRQFYTMVGTGLVLGTVGAYGWRYYDASNIAAREDYYAQIARQRNGGQ